MASYLYLSRTKNEIICVEFARVHVYEPKPKLILLSFLILQKNQILRSESGFFVAFCACTLWTLFSRVLIDRCVSYCFYLLVPRSLLTPTESLISFSIRKKNVRIWIINTRKFENSKMSIDFGRGYIYQEVAGSWTIFWMRNALNLKKIRELGFEWYFLSTREVMAVDGYATVLVLRSFR